MRSLSLALSAIGMLAPHVHAQCFEAKLPTGAEKLGQFGSAVAVDADVALVGAPTEDTFGNSTGTVYVFHRAGDDWVKVAALNASDPCRGDQFGITVALEGDTALIGAWTDDVGRGSVYVFERVGGAFQEVAKMAASDGAPGDLFGGALAMDGDRALVGARGVDGVGSNSGAAYVFDRVGGSWTETARLVAPAGVPFDEFGTAVALDGDTALVGADHEATPSLGKEAAYVFQLVEEEDDDEAWILAAVLAGTAPAQDQGFGSAVALSGGRAFVGAPRDDHGAPVGGAVHVFRDQGGSWPLEGVLQASAPLPFAAFGASVVAEDERVLVGAPEDYSTGKANGAAFTFELQLGEGGGLRWVQTAKLLAPDGSGFDDFGLALALRGDTTLIGAPATEPDQGIEGVYVGSHSGAGCPLLFAAPEEVSASEGGCQGFAIQPGPAYAGMEYLLLGSASGIAPGTIVDGLMVPLNPDVYFRFTIQHPGAAPLYGGYGVMGDEGIAKALLTVPRGTPTMMIGRAVHHAYVIIDPAIPAVVLTSNPVAVDLLP